MGEWWRSAVVYQVYPRSFQDSNGDGVGDLDGITKRLDHLSEVLGVDAVWLSPFYPSPMADFGYDVADYCDVDPLFGDLGAFDRLVAGCHQRGLRVIVDFVPNHSSDQHPWFVESRSSRSSSKRDWYVWRDGRDGGPPNNWLSVFGGSAWTHDDGTDQWYLHSFLAEQPDLNWRNPELRDAMFDAVRFWLDRGVDGLRIDVAHYVMKDPDLRDNPPSSDEAPTGFKPLGDYDSQQHLHDRAHPDVHDVYRGLRAVLDEYEPERFAVGEIHLFDPEEWASYYGDGDELHMPFNFSLLWAEWDATRFRELVDTYDRVVPPHGWPSHVLGNHDEERLASRFGPRRARAAAVLLTTLRGTPTLYYGDEIGMREVEIAPEDQQDPWGRRVPGLGRDGCRTPMQWDASPHAGFTSCRPWLPVGDDAATRNVEAQLADSGSLLALYRRLLAQRRRRAALHAGDYRALDDVPAGCFAYERFTSDEPPVRVYVNFTSEPIEVPVAEGRVLVSTGLDRLGETVVGATELGADEAIVVAAE